MSANHSQTVQGWNVPSTETPGQYYTVEIFPNGATSCTCSWGQKKDAPSKCWHAMFALVMECHEIQSIAGQGVVERAHEGEPLSQLVMLRDCAFELVQQGRFHAAHRCFEVMHKYSLALSVQGAAALPEQATAQAA